MLVLRRPALLLDHRRLFIIADDFSCCGDGGFIAYLFAVAIDTSYCFLTHSASTRLIIGAAAVCWLLGEKSDLW